MFFALKTAHNDGKKYIEDAILLGVRVFCIVNEQKSQKKIGSPRIFSENYAISAEKTVKLIKIIVETPDFSPMYAIQTLAEGYRKQFIDLKTIAITGSNGKTIVKEWLAQAIADDAQIVRSPKSFNSQLGVPMSIFQIENQHNLGIFEAGISKINEIQALKRIIQPQIGIFTNILAAHDEGFSSKQEKADQKAQLFADCEVVIYNKDNIYCENAIKNLKNPPITTFTYSKIDKKADLFIKEKTKSIINDENRNGFFNKITAIYKGEEVYVELPFFDDASIENATTVWATMLYLGYEQTVIRNRFYDLEALEARLEIKAAINNCTLINDSYSLDLDSLKIALNFMQQQDVYGKKTLITSAFSSGNNAFWFEKIGKLLATKQIDKLIIVGEKTENLKPFLPEKLRNENAFFSFKTTDELLQNLSISNLQNETILLKGARKFTLERVAERLSQRAHKTVLEVNMDALKHNFKVYKSLVLPKTKLMAMVKAHAYGSGAYQVAKLLQHQKVDYLAVAYTDEGYDLRQNGITLPIMVMNVEESSFDSLIRHNLAPEIYSLTVLQGFATAVRRFHAAQNTEIAVYNIHLKLDTGMKRLGFEGKDMAELCRKLLENPFLKIDTIFSHLVATDNPEHDKFTHEQVARFKKMSEKISAKIGYKPLQHILNTSGISRFNQQYQFDMVRLGIGLYGVDTAPNVQEKLQTVLTLKATISQVKEIAKGETIGYNRVGKATKKMRIGTVSIGYADGIPRRLSNKSGSFLVENQLAEIVGNVCMDMCMIDISNIPLAKEGSDVIIFGKNRPVQDFASQAQTIPYEAFTAVSSRVKRVYFSE